MDRLTNRVEPNLALLHQNVGMFECIGKLADYEDAEEEKRLFELPFRIGQYLFHISIYDPEVKEFTITAITLEEDGWYIKVQNVWTDPSDKSMFFTTEIPLDKIDCGEWWYSDHEEALRKAAQL